MKVNRIGLLSGIFLMSALLLGCSAKVVPEERVVKPETLPLEPGSSIKEAWEVEWEKTLQGARKEGRIIIDGPAAPVYRRVLVDSFQKVHPYITVEYTGARGPERAPRIQAARRAGIFRLDLYIAGTATILTALKDFAAPIEPYLILSEVKDGKYWLDGKLHFADSAGKLNLVWNMDVKSWLAYNTMLNDPREMENFSYWELTKPKWKGKVLWDDPRPAGASQEGAMFILSNPQLGTDYIKALLSNQPLIIRDKRLAHEWVARGKYPFLLGGVYQQIVEFVEAGLPIKIIRRSKEGEIISVGNGTLIVLDKAPNPNAAKVYLNWLLSREGQIPWVKEVGNASRRVDVPNSELLDLESVPLPGRKYVEFYSEEALKKKDALVQQLSEIIGE